MNRNWWYCVELVCLTILGCSSLPSSEARHKKPELTAKKAAGPGPKDADAPTKFTQTHSGLRYRILRKSTDHQPSSWDTVVCHYRGWLDDGTEFDSSYKRSQPTTFPLQGVIAAWTEGVQLIGEGGMIELEVPSDLGYGANGPPPTIPPNARLHFIIELVKVK